MMNILLLATPKAASKRTASLQCPDAPKKPRVALSRLPPLDERTPRTQLFVAAVEPSSPNDENCDSQISRAAAAETTTTTTTTTTTDTNTTTDTVVQHDLYDDGSTVDVTTVIETTVRRVQTTVSRTPAR
jgi:hypothetical protein